MARLLTSVLAGVLLVVGGWYGWHHAARVDAAVTEVGQAVLPDSSPGRTGDASRGEGRTAGTSRPTQASGSSTSRPGAARTTPGAGGTPSSGPRSTTGDTPGTSHPMPTTGTRPGEPCATPGPTSADGMNQLFGKLDGVPTIEGADHGASVLLADGRRLYTFGDTIRADSVKPFMVRNSILLSDGGCLTPMPVADDGPAIPSRDGTGYWPMSVRAVPSSGGTTVQVITAQVRSTGRGTFETTGSGLATFQVPTNRTPRLVSHAHLGGSTSDPRTPTWGAAMWESGGHIYVYGTASNATKSTAGWSLRVARTTPGRLGNPSAWEYWDGSRWVAGDPSAARRDAAALVPAEQGVSHVLSVFERDGSWYALSKEGDYLGDTLAVWKAPSPTGPFTKHRVAGLANDSAIRRYTPLAHPDFATSSGRLLVSYSQSPQTSRPYFTNPELYRPRFIEITLP